jgi:hypothetical protein
MHARMAFVRRGNVKSERRDLAASGPARAAVVGSCGEMTCTIVLKSVAAVLRAFVPAILRLHTFPAVQAGMPHPSTRRPTRKLPPGGH